MIQWITERWPAIWNLFNTVAAPAILAACYTQMQTSRRSQRELRRAKLEEITMLFIEFSDINLARYRLDDPDRFDELLRRSLSVLAKIQTLANLYFWRLDFYRHSLHSLNMAIVTDAAGRAEGKLTDFGTTVGLEIGSVVDLARNEIHFEADQYIAKGREWAADLIPQGLHESTLGDLSLIKAKPATFRLKLGRLWPFGRKSSQHRRPDSEPVVTLNQRSNAERENSANEPQ